MIRKAKRAVRSFFRRLGISPKVYSPFLAGLATDAYLWVQTGAFDRAELKVLVATFIWGTIGWSVPDGPKKIDLSNSEPELDIGSDKRAEKTQPPATD